MLSDAIKKYRDLLAFGLLAVAVLYLISGVSLLFKSEEDTFLKFSGRAATIGYLFTHPFVIIALVTAVALAIGFGEASANARAIVGSALGIGGISLVLGLVCWFVAFGYDGSGFGGVFMAGKIVSIFLGLAQLLAMGLALFFAVAALQALPKRVPQAQQWGGYAQQGHPQQQWGQQQPQQWGQQPPPQWGQQPPQQWGQQPPQQWGQPAQPEQQWGQQPPQQWGQPAQPEQQWGQPAQPQTWGQHVEPQQPATAWAQPEQQSWGQHAQPSQAWSAPEAQQPEDQPEDQPEAQQTSGQAEQQGWEQPEQQQSWGQPAEHEAQSWAPAEAAEAETTAVSDDLSSPPESQLDSSDVPEDQSAAEPGESDSTSEDTSSEGQQDGWWQRPSQ